jgi:chromosome partitioning protein
MRMLFWFKRSATPALPEQLVEKEPETLPLGEPVQRVERPVVHSAPTYIGTAKTVAARSTPMRVIVVASQKGGAGKTTIAAHLTVRAGMVGEGPAALVDTDPQGSLSEWWDARKRNASRTGNDDAPAFAAVKLDDLSSKLAELRGNGAGVAIVDTPPQVIASIERVMATADLVLIPARPSPHDLRAIGATVSMARRVRKPYVFVINGAASRAHITAEAVAALSEHGPVAPIILYQRTDYAISMIDGRTVMETVSSGRSAREIAELWKYIHAQIGMRAAA